MMKKIIVWLAVMMYTLSGYAQNAPWNFQSKVVTDTLFSKVLIQSVLIPFFCQRVLTE